jgi:hypothetical protein
LRASDTAAKLAERPVKELAQERPGALPLGRRLKRVLDLSEDLGLSDDERVQPRGDPEQMPRRIDVAEREQMRQERIA